MRHRHCSRASATTPMAGRSRRASARAGWRKRSAVAPIQAQPLDHSSDDVLVGLDWRFAEAGHLGLGPVPEERRRFALLKHTSPTVQPSDRRGSAAFNGKEPLRRMMPLSFVDRWPRSSRVNHAVRPVLPNDEALQKFLRRLTVTFALNQYLFAYFV
jgi:hypothetical protein